jgi:lipase chaperone LimK
VAVSQKNLRAISEQIVGAEATERLEALDQERAVGMVVLMSYLQQRDAINKNPALSELSGNVS